MKAGKTHNCPAPRVREEVVFDQLVELFDRMAFPKEIMDDIRVNLSKIHEGKKEFHDESLNALQKEYNDIRKKLGILLDALLNQSITQSEYDTKAQELKQRQHEISKQLTSFDKADDDFVISVRLMLELVNNAGKLFRSSNLEQKRKLISLVCQNLVLNNGKVQYALRTPFELFIDDANCQEWLRE